MSINFSFIIPHKNSPDLLKRCVDSIPIRDDIEVIVVDDNSDDNLKPSLTRSGLVIKLLNHTEAKRAGHARNVGMDIAKGKWLLFADSDDYYNDNLLEFLDKYKDSNKDVIYFNHKRIETNKSSFQKRLIEKSFKLPLDIDIIKYRINAPWNKMVNRQFVIDNCIRFEECVNGNDMFFSYQVGYLAKDIEVNKSIIYNYDTSIDGMTNKKKNSDEYYLCRINHWHQTNEFYRNIGHKEWISFLPFRFLAILNKKGFKGFMQCLKVYVINYRSIQFDKMKYVRIITKNS
jgi:glycosyltransferase involved in cell wall biosynthesis